MENTIDYSYVNMALQCDVVSNESKLISSLDGIGKRMGTDLLMNGFVVVGDLTKYTENEVMNSARVGRKTMSVLKEELAKLGLGFCRIRK